MKNKWLIVLFILFLGVLLLSVLITQESQKAIFLSEKETLVEQAESRVLPAYSARVAKTAATPLTKSGITIIKTPSGKPEEKSISVPRMADKTANNVSSRNVASNVEAVEAVEDSLQVGITKTGKQPTPKEAQEMNSSGIVLY